ncbi:CDAN1-interacting nuclease 1 [Geodia barretti]|uniref:CDAN1-interacting nuclease 1 n=1 Tax=Geodia barretti TaxID=519541 RepID=A0AA35TYT8_GEOBA|nr:CDAN1-interacting nuclease 1 [Geodia barretti]
MQSSVIAEREYDELARIIESRSFRRDSLQLATARFPQIPEESLLSIYSQLVRLHTKRTYWQHNKLKTKLEYYQSYLVARETGTGTGDLLLQLAEKVCLSPALYGRIILEQYAESIAAATPPATVTASNACGTPTPSATTSTPPTTNATTSTPPTTNTTTSTLLTFTKSTAALATPTKVVTTPTTVSVSTLVNQWMKNPLSIPDTTLQLHIKTCIFKDTHYGPLADNIKRSVGYEYEFLLREKVQELAVPFLDEEGLRARGYDKTPDIKLEVPIAVDGHIVNWIESKASFGDRTCHEQYMEDQFWSYQNRFGSGLVIYWFGYVSELNSFQDQGILLTERFPDPQQITKLALRPLISTP